MAARSTDVLIIGAGPAGLQLAYELKQQSIDHIVLESSSGPGASFRHFPRHRTLISINKPNVGSTPGSPWRFDWNSLIGDDDSARFTTYTSEYFPHADRYVEYLADYAARHSIKVNFNTRVDLIERNPNGAGYRVLTSNDEDFIAKRVVVATGLAESNVPDIPGIEHTELYTNVDIDPENFKNQRVLIIGKGNSAFETADNLIGTAATIHLCSPNPVQFAWKSHYVGHLRAVNNNFLDTYLLKSQNASLDARIDSIEKTPTGFQVQLTYTHANGHQAVYDYDRVITCTGFRADTSIFSPELKVELANGKHPAMDSGYQAVNAPGLYFAGTLTHARDFRKTASGFIHGFRYNVHALARFLTATQEGLAPEAALVHDPATLASAALRRMNESDALFLQPGYLCDIFVPDSKDTVHHYAGLPLDYVREQFSKKRLWTLTLEYGPQEDDPFRIEREHSPEYAARTPFLHPVVRFFVDGAETERLDLLEDLENRYGADHAALIQEFFAQCGKPSPATEAPAG